MDGKDVKRRFVQSTLFPHRGSSAKEDGNCGDGEGEEEASGSGKRRRRTANSKSKTAPRASSKRAIVNGKESKQVDDSDPSAPEKSNFFVKASERVEQKGVENSLVIIDFPDGTDVICSPPTPAAESLDGRSTPQKLNCRENSTPRKETRKSTPTKKMKNGRRELFSGQIPFEVAVDEQPLPAIPDLRLEAKLAAEENSRIFSGRRLHPFFMSRKGGKTNLDLTDPENRCSSFERKENGITFNPIHVFQNVEDDQTILNWGHWIFSEGSTGGDICGYSPVYEGSIDALHFGNFLNGSQSTRVSLYENCHQCSAAKREVFEELPYKPECSLPTSSLILADERVAHSQLEKDPDFQPNDTKTILTGSSLEDNKIERYDLFNGLSGGGSIDSELQDKLLQERTTSHHHACHSQPENSLWTDKYQPQNAKQICGNGKSVKFLSEWLHLWHKRGSQGSKGCVNESNLIRQDNYQESDSDYDSTNDEDGLKNVLLITGPVGSGKSAAIYACARDQGFQIIEINSSDWRNGALVRQKFGEAVESHWLQRTAENTPSSESKCQSNLSKAFNEASNCLDNKIIEPSDKEDSQEAGGWSKLRVSEENSTPNSQNEIKTLILFEDVDATIYDDHGFITTIQQLAETAKRPMILTSNRDNPILPKNLDRSELRFCVPSGEELLGLIHMICASEEATVYPSLVERFVNHCQRDIRKTIMLLQFWCQGRTLGKDYPRDEFQTTNWLGPGLFDLDAGHHVLPKVICWDYPSKLSDLVADEVVKSLVLVEETYGLMNENGGTDQNNCIIENIHTPDSEPDPVEVKKKAMLRLHCSHDEAECAQLEANSELFDFSCSPVASTRGKGRSKINTVLSSDSEEEVPGCSTPLDCAGVNINVEVLDTENLPIYDYVPTQLNDDSTKLTCHSEVEASEDTTQVHGYLTGPYFHPEVYRLEDQCTHQLHDLSAGPTYQLEGGKLEDHCLVWEPVDYSHTEENACKLHDISLVPESSFVPETQIIEEELHSVTVSYGHFMDAIGTLIIKDQDSVPIPEPSFDANSSKSLHIQETIGIDSEPSVAGFCQEEVADSLSKCEAEASRGYQWLDECSRVDFVKGLKSFNNPEADQAVDFVKETWKKLYDRSNDLRKYVAAEEKPAYQGLILVQGMSNLISEADLLLKDCQTLVSDFLELPPMIPGEKIDSCYYENQMEMSTILFQHGMCHYAKEIASLGSKMGWSTNTSQLALEMLSSSASSAALGKLAIMDQRKVASSDIKTTKGCGILTRSSKSNSSLSNALETIVPPRLHLAARGKAFHEYISSLSQISRLDASRLLECSDNRTGRRRRRVPQHYLSSGSLAMGSEEISLLGQCNSYQKCSRSNA